MFQPVIVEFARSFLPPSPYIMLKRSISLVSQRSYGMVLLGYNQQQKKQKTISFLIYYWDYFLPPQKREQQY